MNPLGKILIFAGAAIILLGVALLFFDRIPLLGKLPGDFVIRHKSLTLYFPLTTSLAVSVLLSIVLLVINYLKK